MEGWNVEGGSVDEGFRRMLGFQFRSPQGKVEGKNAGSKSQKGQL